MEYICVVGGFPFQGVGGWLDVLFVVGERAGSVGFDDDFGCFFDVVCFLAHACPCSDDGCIAAASGVSTACSCGSGVSGVSVVADATCDCDYGNQNCEDA